MELDRSPRLPLLLCLVALTGCQTNWGLLANPGFEGQAVRTTLFFAGQPLDGTTIPQNGCGQSPTAFWCYTAHPKDPIHLEWRNPVNRLWVLNEIVDAGFNTLSMSTWGESWLPCTTACPFIPAADCGEPTTTTREWRCSKAGDGSQTCRIGWYGSANMQVSPAAKDELFDAASQKPILILPFIESRFGFDWDFRDEFPRHPQTHELAPGLVSQIKDLISRYIKNPRNGRWPAKWAQIYDRDGHPRYAIAIVQASSDVLGPDDHAAFAQGFDDVANQILAETQVPVGFLIDPVPRNPESTFGCPGVVAPVSTYGAQFKPDPVLTGPFLRAAKSILGIHAYSPEGWLDGKPGEGVRVNECFKIAWKKEWSRQWRDTGIPFLQDVTPGYDGTKLFPDEPWRLRSWGNNPVWRNELLTMVRENGRKGFVYHSWNGYCEGLAGMSTAESQQTNPLWIKQLMAIYGK